MKAIRELLRDGRRSQRGSVLSGVLIMTAFIAIIAGALSSELSTNFLLSRDLMNRAATEATVDSAMELALNQMQTSPIPSGCPDLSTTQAALNGQIAVVSYTSCWPDYREKAYSAIASGGGSFTVDGSHSLLPGANPSQDLYLVGDSAGNVYQFPIGQSTPNWVYQVPGSVTGPPVTVQDVYKNQTPQDLMTLVPFTPGSNPPAGCSPSIGCVAMLAEDTNVSPRIPDVFCYMTASADVTTAAAMGVNNPTVGFFGDENGSMFAYSVSEKTVPCPQKAKVSGSGAAVLAGPFVFAGPGGADEVYVVTSSSVLRYTYKLGLAPVSTLSLPQAGVVGIALETNTLPARMAISFSDGHLAMVQLGSDYSMSVLSNIALPASFPAAPSWCHCPGGDQIVVGGSNGAFYLLDPSLNVLSSMPAGGPAPLTAPAPDSVGEWFFGAGDGYVYEYQRHGGQMVQVNRLGPVGGAIRSTLQVAPCANEICLYVATQSGNAYRVPLDARDAVISACISTSAPACSGANPRLWSSIEVGREGFPNEVHVLGWTYYSA